MPGEVTWEVLGPQDLPYLVAWAQGASRVPWGSCHFSAGEHPAERLFSEPVTLIFFLGELFCNIAS